MKGKWAEQHPESRVEDARSRAALANYLHKMPKGKGIT